MPISELLSHPGFKKYFANTGWLFVGRILQMAVGLFVGVYVARYLGPNQYGLLSYTMAFVGLFSAIASLGLNGIVVRELVKTPQKLNELLGTAFFLKIVGAVLMFCAIIIGTRFFNNDNFTNLLIIIIASGYIFQAFDVIDLNFQATVKSRYVVQAQIAQLIISSIIKLLLIWIGAPLIWFAIVFLIDVIVLAAGLVYNYLRNGGQILAWKFKLATAKSLLKDSWPLILAGLSIAIYMKIDQVMVKMMLGDKEVGFYAVAVKLSEMWYFIPIIISSSIYPGLVKAYNKSEEQYYNKLKIIMGYCFWVSLVFSLVIANFSYEIIAISYGVDYIKAAGVLSIHIYSGIIVSMSVFFSQKFILDGSTKISLYGTIVGAVSNVILNLWLIKSYGINGAAIATLFSYIVPMIFQSIFFDKRIGLVFLESVCYLFKKKHV